MEKHHAVAALVEEEYLSYERRHCGISTSGTNATEHTSAQQTAPRLCEGTPDIGRSQNSQSHEVDRAFSKHTHQGYPQDVSYAEHEDVKSDEKSCICGIQVEVFSERHDCDSEVAAVHVGNEGEKAHRQVD